MTMQQVMGMMQGLQEAMAALKAEQERMQADLTASQARNTMSSTVPTRSCAEGGAT